MQREIQGLLSKLPGITELAIVLRDLQALSYEEIASVLRSIWNTKIPPEQGAFTLRDLYLQTEQNSVSEHLKDKGGVQMTCERKNSNKRIS